MFYKYRFIFMIEPLEHLATLPLRGREVNTDKKRKTSRRAGPDVDKEIPLLQFEKDTIKKKNVNTSGASNSNFRSTSKLDRLHKNAEGVYAMKLSDSTWASTSVAVKDVPPTRDEVKGLISKYEQNLSIYSGYEGAEYAIRVQGLTDLFLNELSNQLRVVNLGQTEIVEKSKESYARIFQVLLDDATAGRKKIIELETMIEAAIEEKNRTIDECNNRISQSEIEAIRKIEEANFILQKRTEDYDNSMKTFLEQKNQLEEHVKTLHHVFLDFQSDAVYLTLEDLKQKLSKSHQRVIEKEEDVTKLQMAIQKWRVQYQQMSEKQKELEEANLLIRTQLQEALTKNNQLQRQNDQLKSDLKFLNSTNDILTEEIKPQSPFEKSGSHTQLRSTPTKSTRNFASLLQFNSVQFLEIYRKLSLIGSSISPLIEQSTGKESLWNDHEDDNNEISFLSVDFPKAVSIIENKVDSIVKLIKMIPTDEDDNHLNNQLVINAKASPRFVEFFSRGIIGKPNMGNKSGRSVFYEVRRILQSKYLCDKWNKRSGRPLIRFPEFVLSFYILEEERVSAALHECQRLWKLVSENNSTETKLFTSFLTETYSNDELSFFLEMRNSLIGLPTVSENDPSVIKVDFAKCKELIEHVVGSLSSTSENIMRQTEKIVENNEVNYADFLHVFMKFYSSERSKRRDAIKLMVYSKQFSDGVETPILIETFVSMMQTLGFTGSVEDILDFYHTCTIFSQGNVSADGVLQAMDHQSMHFYSIDTSFSREMFFDQSEPARQMIVEHWMHFGQWFGGLRRVTTGLDSWAKKRLSLSVRRVEQAFQQSKSGSTLYSELRNLYDTFQYVLWIIFQGLPTPTTIEHAEKHLRYLENVNEFLLNSITKVAK